VLAYQLTAASLTVQGRFIILQVAPFQGIRKGENTLLLRICLTREV
jgi:hypothetical protein